jgi:hypothetical protein
VLTNIFVYYLFWWVNSHINSADSSTKKVDRIVAGLIVTSVSCDCKLCPQTPFSFLKVKALIEFWISKIKLKSLGPWILYIDIDLCILWKYSVSVRLKITKRSSKTDQAVTLKQQVFRVTFKYKKIRISKEYEKYYHREFSEKKKYCHEKYKLWPADTLMSRGVSASD